MLDNFLFSVLYKHYLKDTSHKFYSLTNGRFWPVEITGDYPSVDKYPTAMYTILSYIDGGLIEDKMDNIMFQISCFGRSINESLEMAMACRDLFENVDLGGNGCEVIVSFVNMTGPFRQGNDEPFMTAITFITIMD